VQDDSSGGEASENGSQIPRKFWNLVLEKDGEGQLWRSSEKWGSIAWSQGGEEYLRNKKKKEG